MRFTDACEAKTNFKGADFWVVAKGPKRGEPVKAFAPEHIGIRVTRRDVLVPNYLYYLMRHLKNQGIYLDVREVTPASFNGIVFTPT